MNAIAQLKEQATRAEQLQAAYEHLSALNSAREDADRKRYELSMELQRLDLEDDLQRMKHEKLTTQVETLSREIEALMVETEATKKEIETLKKDEQKPAVTTGDLQAAQLALTDAEGAYHGFKVHLQEQQAIIEAAEAARPDMTALEQQREDLAAKVAIGEAKQADLAKLEEKIASTDLAYRKTHAKKARRAKAAIAGLQRKIEAADVIVEQRQQELAMLVDGFIEAEMVRTAAKVERAGKALAKAYGEALGLYQLAADRGLVRGQGPRARLQKRLPDLESIDARTHARQAREALEGLGISL